MNLTQPDKDALARMPDDWFSPWDHWREIKKIAWRCDRLFEMGYLEEENFLYRKTPKARELAGKENKDVAI